MSDCRHDWRDDDGYVYCAKCGADRVQETLESLEALEKLGHPEPSPVEPKGPGA